MDQLPDILAEKRQQCSLHQQNLADARANLEERSERLFLRVIKLFEQLRELELMVRQGIEENAELVPLPILEPGSVQTLLYSKRGIVHIKVSDIRGIHNMRKDTPVQPYIEDLDRFLVGKSIDDETLYFCILISYGFKYPQWIQDGLYVLAEGRISEILVFIMDILVQVEAADQDLLYED